MARPSNDSKVQAARALSDKQLSFAVWFATPAGLRKPETMEQVAEVLGVSRQALWRWSKDPRVLDAARYVVLQNAGDPDRVASVLDMIHQVAVEKRDVKYAELWLRAVGVFQVHTNRDLSLWDHVTEDSLDRLSDEALEALRAAKEAESLEEARIAAARVKLGGAPGVADGVVEAGEVG